MKIIEHKKHNMTIAEVVADGVIIATADDGSQLLADLYYQGYDIVAIRAEQLHPDFFELKTGMAGEIMQKCSNWRIRLVIIGDFSNVTSKSLHDLIYESNKGKLVNFLATIDNVLKT